MCQTCSSQILRRVSVAVVSLRSFLPTSYGTSATELSRRESLIRVILSMAWLLGVTAIISSCSSNSASETPSPIATVTTVSVEEVENYAKAVLAIEQSRQAAYSEIQQIINEEQVPNFSCTQADTIYALPGNVRDIAVNYCERAKDIGETQGLTMTQFNAITVTAQSDSELLKRIQNELVRLQWSFGS